MDDTIYRQDAINALNDDITVTGYSNVRAVGNYMQKVAKRLQNLPPAEPGWNVEQKKQIDAFKHWVKTNTENGVSVIPAFICKDIIAILEEKK